MVDVGQVVSGKYKLLRLLGDGGMGSVFEAIHLGLGTHVALKVLHTDLARRPGIAERFLQEARVSAQIRSPHVVQVLDVDRTAEGVAYLVMELLQGEPLAAVMKRERRLALGTACEYASQILQALEAAHALGVIHRDLKPDNVFVTFPAGRPMLKLIDFGIAKLKTAEGAQAKNLTVAGMLMGTPEYMAPEQAYSADKVDVRADLYAVGVMLYEMLSGMPPATGEDPRVLILKVERGEVTPLVQAAPGIDPQLAGFVHRAMAPRPELRFSTSTEMRVALEEITLGKRAGTAKIPAAVLPPSVVVGAPAAASLALADTAGPRPEPGTGTVMGAPAIGALSPLPMPAVAAYHPPAHYGPPPGPSPAPRPRRRGGGGGLVWGLAIVALLLGAGAVVAYVASTTPNTPAVVTAVPTTAPTPPAPTATAALPTATASVVAAATPLSPAAPVRAPTNPAAPAKKDAGAAPQAPPDAGVSTTPISTAVTVADAGGGQTTITTPFGTFQFPGPRPPFYPADQPWPPSTTVVPLPGQ